MSKEEDIMKDQRRDQLMDISPIEKLKKLGEEIRRTEKEEINLKEFYSKSCRFSIYLDRGNLREVYLKIEYDLHYKPQEIRLPAEHIETLRNFIESISIKHKEESVDKETPSEEIESLRLCTPGTCEIYDVCQHNELRMSALIKGYCGR